MKRIVLALVFVMLAGATAQAQSVPPLVNYQGLLTDAAGKPQTGTKNLEFNLYDAATGGNKVWGPQVFKSVPLVSGMFNVILGTTDSAGRSIADAFGAKDRYLGMKVDDGTELVPRQQILSTPFAIQSEHSAEATHAQKADIAETVQGSDLYINSDSNVGIGTSSPGEKLEVNGNAKVNGIFKAKGFSRSNCTTIDSAANGGTLMCPDGQYVVGAINSPFGNDKIDNIICCSPE
jgi:hypothetical protein